MKTRFSRRTFVKLVGAAGAVLLAKMSGLIPEAQFAMGAGPSSSDGKRVKVRQLRGAELEQAVAQARSHPDSKASWYSLEKRGHKADFNNAMAIEVSLQEGGRTEKIGGLLTVPFHDNSSKRHGKFVFHSIGDKTKTGSGLWSDEKADEMEVVEMVNGQITHSSWLRRQSNGSTIIDWANGNQTLVSPPSRPKTSSERPARTPGLASPLQQGSCHQDCNYWCGLVCAVTCALEWSLICDVCAGVSFGFCVPACVVVATVVCYQGCTTDCNLVCDWVCD